MTPVALVCAAILLTVSAGQAQQGRGLTSADVLGPDGVVYPDWTYAGIPGGIPEVPIKARITDFGAVPGDDGDDSRALQGAVDTVGASGGGAVLIPAGTWHLDWPVVVRHSGVVIRGEGPEKTRLINRYCPPAGTVHFFEPRGDHPTIHPGTWVEAHAAPYSPSGERIVTILIYRDGRRVHGRTPEEIEKLDYKPEGDRFWTSARGNSLFKGADPGEHVLRAVAIYAGGEKTSCQVPVTFTRPDSYPWVRSVSGSNLGAITFLGNPWAGGQIRLARDGKRGDMALVLASVEGLREGDYISLTAPATERWNRLLENTCRWGSYRRNQYRIRAVDRASKTVDIGQPLRIDFPIVDGSYVQQMAPLVGCGVEDFCLEQTQKIWTSGVTGLGVWHCWARNVHVKKAGRFPVYFWYAKQCEIRDCRFDDAWYHGGGGTAYVGWEVAYDCLMENVHAIRMRHAPLFQWSASGCVIRNSVFDDCDAQWHSGYTNENLMENCTIRAGRAHGNYGHAFWSSPPEDRLHGPNGPRNVVYNCDASAPYMGFWLGGNNAEWKLLYNRVVVDAGVGHPKRGWPRNMAAIYLRKNSDDYVIQGNVFVIKGADSPLIYFEEGCDGTQVIGNVVVGGSGKIAEGRSMPGRDEGNVFDGPTDRPAPPVPSIFDWQRR